MKDFKVFIKMICMGWLLDYHLKQRDKKQEDIKFHEYHYEKVEYYFKKIFGTNP